MLSVSKTHGPSPNPVTKGMTAATGILKCQVRGNKPGARPA
jgi:hypothetical protein